MAKFSNTDDVIDSRDIIERIEELESEREALHDAVDECRDAYNYHNSEDTEEGPEWDDLQVAITALVDWSESEEAEELRVLQALQSEAESCSDWSYGETLINEDYFTKYITELIHDCYEMPKEINSGDWPYRHMSIDYDAAADEAKADYTEVDFDGVTYLIRA